MKFGEEFAQRSIPQWAGNNIDYDEIKSIIKDRTSTDQVKALAIPGQGADVKERQDLEDELFEKFREEHDRANLFIKIKCNEIQRKLNDLQRQVQQLTRQAQTATRTVNPARQQEKFSLLEARITRVGDEVQDLQQFVSANLTAVKKLLKKYKRWTGSSALETRFAQEVLNKRSSYLTRQYGELLSRYADVLTACRDAYNNRGQAEPSKPSGDLTPSPKGKQTVSRQDGESSRIRDNAPAVLFNASESDSNILFDTTLAILPLGSDGGRAIYWVHPDNLMGLRILLLEYTNSRTGKTRPPMSTSASRSSISSLHKALLAETASDSANIGEQVNLAIFDNVDKFSHEQSSVTIRDVETAQGSVSEKATISARWAATNEAVVALLQSRSAETLDSFSLDSPLKKERRLARLRRKSLRTLFNPDLPIPRSPLEDSPGSKSDLIAPAGDNTDPLDEVRTFIKTHQEIKLLVQIQSRRSRYVGVKNTSASGLWATLDTEIVFQQINVNDVGQMNLPTPPETSTDSGVNSLRFPHSVLEVRWEGGYATDLIQALDQNHLVERVRGFSLETHAVATICKPKDMPQPFWFPTLERDIRKIPRHNSVGSNRADGKQSAAESGSVGGTTSVTSNDQSGSGLSAPNHTVSSATSVREYLDSEATIASPKKKRDFTRNYGTNKRRQASRSLHARYWNEFDDGDEAAENEPYVIYIDPNAPDTFPGVESLKRFSGYMSDSASSAWKSLRVWTVPENKGKGVLRPLLEHHDIAAQTSQDSSDSDIEDVEAQLTRQIREQERRRSILARNQLRRRHYPERERILFWVCVGSFFASFVILLPTAFLPYTSRRKDAFETEVGVAVGVSASLVFSIVGLSCLLLRHDRLSAVHRSAVVLAFCIVCGVSGFLLSLLGHARG